MRAAGPVAQVGRPAPDLAGTDLSGARVSLAAQRGHPVLVNFWASWCTPCRAEFPILADALVRHPGLVVLGVVERDDPGAARSFARERHAGWPSLFDGSTEPGPAARAFDLRQFLPATYAVGSDGVLRARHLGELTPSDVEGLLAAVRA
ncbi:MAG: TlpA family protein disulfide reductase [Acidimicrobiales bacterium]